MLPSLAKLSLKSRSVDGTLEDVMVGRDCVICFGPLNVDSETYPWDGTGFWLRQACTNDPGHFFHAGCLRNLVRANHLAPCPQCRAPLLNTVRALAGLAPRRLAPPPSREPSMPVPPPTPSMIPPSLSQQRRAIRRRRIEPEELRADADRENYPWNPDLLQAASAYIRNECIPSAEALENVSHFGPSMMHDQIEIVRGQLEWFSISMTQPPIDGASIVKQASILLNVVILITETVNVASSQGIWNVPPSSYMDYLGKLLALQTNLLTFHVSYFVPAYDRFPVDTYGWHRRYYNGDYQFFINQAQRSVSATAARLRSAMDQM